MSSKKNNTIQENFEDAKGVIRSRKLKEGQCNGKKKKNKRTSNDLQNTTQKLAIEQYEPH